MVTVDGKITQKVIKVNNIRRLYIFAIAIIFISVSNCNHDGDFVVKVIDIRGCPVMGACIAGGIDWDMYSVYTNFEGIAIVPGHARGEGSTITKNNFLPCFIEELTPTTYMLESAPQNLKLLGDITGDAIRFESTRILTVTYHGEYYVYSYDNDDLKEIATAQLPNCIRFFKTYGDTLWLSTHENGFYAYSLQNPLQPQLMCHLNIPGCDIRPFAVKDTFIAVGSWEDYPRLYSFGFDGHYQEITIIDTISIMQDMIFISDFLIAISSYNEMPIVYDLTDSVNPRQIYRNSESIYWDDFLYKHYLFLYHHFWAYYDPDTSATYKLIDLSDPANPQKLGPLPCDAMITNIVSDNYAIGSYYGAATSVLYGNLLSGFSTVAIGSGGFCGGLPPYFILGYQLWKLED